MEFITNIIMLITSFFGWGTPEPTPQLAAAEVVQPAATEVAMSSEGETEATISNEQSLGSDTSTPTNTVEASTAVAPVAVITKNMWLNYQKPSESELQSTLDKTVFRVTQKNGTESPKSSPLDRNYEPGIYVDVLSGEPLYSSKDKYDSGTGWPSWTKPITPGAVEEVEDNILFYKRTEIRSKIADNHLGHVFTDGPKESTGLRYCMNGAALRFIPQAEMEAKGYGDYLQYI